jgi:putative transposase
VLKANGLSGSMGRVASAVDNAAMESFNALLQNNVLNRRAWRTRDELHHAIIDWVEQTYDHRRRQRGLAKLTPAEFELAFTIRPPPARPPNSQTQQASTRPTEAPTCM